MLHCASTKYRLPWQRVVGSRGVISLRGAEFAEQRRRLRAEGVAVDRSGRVDLDVYLWEPEDSV